MDMGNSWTIEEGMYGSSWTQRVMADYTDITVFTSILFLYSIRSSHAAKQMDIG